MSYTLVDAIEAVQVLVEGVTGIRAAPVYAPESLSVFPISVAFPGNSTWEIGPVGSGKSLQTIVVEIHLQRVDLPRDIQAAMAFSDAVPLAILAGWNGVPTIGFRFFVEGIKMVTSF